MKGEPGYKLDPALSGSSLFLVAWYRLWQLLRGYLLKVRIHADGAVFCGKRVTVRHPNLVRAGKSFILEDGARLYALSANGFHFGDRVTIGVNAVLVGTGVIANLGKGIRIGNRSAIGSQSYLGGQGGIEIGDDVIMGPQVKIFSENHNFGKTDVVIRLQGESRKGVNIGNNCWVGAGATILDGVTLGNGCVVAAGSVVTHSFPDNAVVMGTPARLVKSRN